jgi:hypothetical protein
VSTNPPNTPNQVSPDGKYQWNGTTWVPMAGPAKKGHFWRNGAIGCGGLIVLAIIIGVAASGNHSTSPSIAASSPSNSTATAKASAKATAPAGPKILLDKTGTGINKTAIFTTGSEWEIDWTYDCANFGLQGNFQIYVYDGSSTLKDLPVNALGLKGSDVAYEHNLSGPYYLEMNSECDWHVIVKG